MHRRANDVVVRQRCTVVAVGFGDCVANAGSAQAARGAVRPLRGDLSEDSHQPGLRQHDGDVSTRLRQYRGATEDLLILDELGSGRAHTLHDEIEPVGLAVLDAVVVDGRPQVLTRAGVQSDELQQRGARGQCDRRRVRSIDDAHDVGAPTAVLEELLDGVGQGGWLPQAAEMLLEFAEARDHDRLIHRPLQRAADEGGDGRWRTVDRAL